MQTVLSTLIAEGASSRAAAGSGNPGLEPRVCPREAGSGRSGGTLDTVAHARWEDFLPTLPDACVDLVAIDPPYGATDGAWDKPPDLPALWRELRRVCKGVVVMTAGQPFTTDVINSNRAEFRYAWVWNKVAGANFASVEFMPLRVHEDVLVFRPGTYNPQKTPGAKNHGWKTTLRNLTENVRGKLERPPPDESGMKWPTSIITVAKHTSRECDHRTQKPIGLMRYLVETYSNPGDVVLDCFAGSGSTLVASRESGRRFIGCEMLAENVAVIHSRLAQGFLPMGGGGAEQAGDSAATQQSGAGSQNDPKLSDRGGWRECCAAGLLGAALVTAVAVRCSAWLGDVGSPAAFEYVDLAAYNIARVAGCVSNVIAANTAESRGSIFERRSVLEVVSEFGNVAVKAVNAGVVSSPNGVNVLRIDALQLGAPLTEKVEEGTLAGVSFAGGRELMVGPPTDATPKRGPSGAVKEYLSGAHVVALFGVMAAVSFGVGWLLGEIFGRTRRESPNDETQRTAL